MPIRKPVAQVLAACADAAITTRLWSAKRNGKLEPGAHVRWTWGLHGDPTGVAVKDIAPDRRIVIAWDGDNPATIEWQITPHTADTPFVSITDGGFRGDGAALVAQALASAGGLTLILAGCKALPEHGIERNLVGERHPAGEVRLSERFAVWKLQGP